MASFRFQAARPDGRIVAGVVQADGIARARTVVAARGLYPIAVDEAGAGADRRRQVNRRDLTLFFRSLASLEAAGVPLSRALAVSAASTTGRLAGILAGVQEDLAAGLALSAALGNAGGAFPGVALGMLRAGEYGGQLGAALEEVATHLEAEVDLQSQVRHALAYPGVLAVVGAGSVILITTVILPRFASLLADAGASLPPTTAALLATSSFATHHALVLLLTVLGGTGVVVHQLSRPEMRLRLEEWLLMAPFVGPVVQALSTARVTRALGGFLAAGMPLLPAIRAAGEAAGNEAIKRRLDRVVTRVAQGEPFARSLSAEQALTSSAVQLVAVGEGSGQLALMTLRAGILSAQEGTRMLKTLVGLLEPALVITFGGMVAFVAAALLQAVYGLRPGG